MVDEESIIRCIWCQKEWEWDWCEDTVKGINPRWLPTPCDGLDGLSIWFCTCGGTLAIGTEEAKGAGVLAHLKG